MDTDGGQQLWVPLGEGDRGLAAGLVVAHADHRDHAGCRRSVQHGRQIIRKGRVHQMGMRVNQHNRNVDDTIPVNRGRYSVVSCPW